MTKAEKIAKDGKAKSAKPTQSRARASVALIRQPHGGAINPPTPTVHKPGSSWSAIQREISDTLRTELAPKATKVMGEMLESPDDRVRIMAADKVWERAFGKAGEQALQIGNGGESYDVSLLTGDERLRLMQAMQIVTECKDLMRARSANRDGGTIEGNAAV